MVTILPLTENIKFCKIATQIQDALAASPLMNLHDMATLDNQLVEWYHNLPPVLHTGTQCPKNLLTARSVMKSRYQNLRIVLHRPVLLSYALRRIPYHELSLEEQQAIEVCTSVARETIYDISREWRPNQIIGWNATWFLHQAVMIPLISLFIDPNNPMAVQENQDQIETTLGLFGCLSEWSFSAHRSREVVSKVLVASKRFAAKQLNQQTIGGGLEMTPHVNFGTGSAWNDQTQVGVWDYMMWSDPWDTENMPFFAVPDICEPMMQTPFFNPSSGF